MTPAIQVVLSGTLTFGIPLLLALHELASLRRRDGGDDGRRRAPEPEPPPLPPCLLVPPEYRRQPVRSPTLETV